MHTSVQDTPLHPRIASGPQVAQGAKTLVRWAASHVNDVSILHLHIADK